MPNAVINLIKLKHGKSFTDLTRTTDHLVAGVPHGWVHEPHVLGSDLRQHWDLFLLTRSTIQSDVIEAHVSFPVSIPNDQFEKLCEDVNTTPTANRTTPALPDEFQGGIPKASILEKDKSELGVGELQLFPRMAEFLSTALPDTVRNQPVSLFNLFKYKGDSSVHDTYMEDFKREFGDSAGARVKFMGPVTRDWDDANLVQYDTVWHYAYMLSTNVYQKLNKDKIRGLDDTCILLVSEIELLQ